MAFDPDAYLANTPPPSSGFDPDAYLAGQAQAPSYQGTALENTAQALRGVGNAIAPYAQQVLSQPDVQPFNGANPFSKPQGGPLQQVLGSMRQVASLPTRLSATLGQASQPVADYVAEKSGQPGSLVNRAIAVGIGGPLLGNTSQAQSMAANPYIGATAATLAGAAADPRSWVPVGGMSMDHPNELPDSIAQTREARTGVPARQFKALYKDPGAIFAGGDVEQAGKNIGTAKEAAGINMGITNDPASMTAENVDRINPTKAVKMEDIQTVLDKVSSGAKPTPQEAQNALDSVNSILSQPSVQNNRDMFRQWAAVKTHINNTLADVAPDVRAANQAFAREKLGETFSPMEAVNKSGKPSKLAMLAKQVPAAAGAGIGGAVGGAGGAAVGYEIGKGASSLYHAPYIAGLQTAAGSVANRTINPLLDYLEKAGTSPQVQAYVARFLEQTRNQNR